LNVAISLIPYENSFHALLTSCTSNGSRRNVSLRAKEFTSLHSTKRRQRKPSYFKPNGDNLIWFCFPSLY